MTPASCPPISFKTPAAFRAWLAKNHAKVTELLVRCYRIHASGRGITYPQALDEALCYGWIDGVRRPLDGDSFSTRFTPRKAQSNWSRVNVAHVERLTAAGRMAKPGLDAFARRTEARTGVYSYERPIDLDAACTKVFKGHKAAWTYYQAQAPWYRRTSARWVMEAKKTETRDRRLAQLIECSEQGKPIPPLDRGQASGIRR
jgi:uncharacterized protein YdeI (YjbR/CyaY-like superfamily)